MTSKVETTILFEQAKLLVLKKELDNIRSILKTDPERFFKENLIERINWIEQQVNDSYKLLKNITRITKETIEEFGIDNLPVH